MQEAILFASEHSIGRAEMDVAIVGGRRSRWVIFISSAIAKETLMYVAQYACRSTGWLDHASRILE
jgi:hypothetical protein